MTSDRAPRLLVPDNTPLSLLAMVGEEALDWLFEPGVEVWVTDMVRFEALREPDAGDDPRREHRAVLSRWFEKNANRLLIVETPQGQDYAREMRNWERGGRVSADKPSWRNRGEMSIMDVVPLTERLLGEGEALLVLMDDRDGRAAISRTVLRQRIDADIMGTETFVALIEREFLVEAASSAWLAIGIASGSRQPDASDPDPVYVRGR